MDSVTLLVAFMVLMGAISSTAFLCVCYVSREAQNDETEAEQ